MSRWWKKFKVKASNTVEGVKRKALYKKTKRRTEKGKLVDEEMVTRGDPVIYQGYKKRFSKDKTKYFKDSGWRVNPKKEFKE